MQNAIPNENLPVDGAAARGRARSIPAPLLHAGGLLAVALFAVAIRLIPASVEWISNDAVEYRDAGRRLAEGKGFTLSIKAYHFVRTPLEHYAGYDRPPLYPMALAALRRLSADPRAPAWLNMAFAALAAMLVALLGARLDSRAAGYWAALLAGAAPALVRSSYYAWSEPLALLLALGAIWIFLGAERPGRLGWMPLAGALCGLAFLARPALFYVPVSLAAYVAVAPGWSSVRRFGGFCSLCGGFAFFLAPLVILNVSHGAAPWTTAQAYIYRSLRFADGMYFGWGKAWESSVFDVVKEHPREIGLEIYRHGRDYAKALFLGGGWLGVYSIALPFLLWRDAQRGLPHGQTLLLGLALAGLAFHTLTWPTKDADRFLQLPFVALLILAVGQVQAFAREWQKRLAGRGHFFGELEESRRPGVPRLGAGAFCARRVLGLDQSLGDRPPCGAPGRAAAVRPERTGSAALYRRVERGLYRAQSGASASGVWAGGRLWRDAGGDGGRGAVGYRLVSDIRFDANCAAGGRGASRRTARRAARGAANPNRWRRRLNARAPGERSFFGHDK